MLGLFRPPEQATHRVEKIARLRRCAGAAIAPCDDNGLRDGADRLVSGRLDHLLEMVFAVTARGERQISPGGGLAIAFDQPGKRPGRGPSFRGTEVACKRSLIFGVKFRRAELGPDPGAPPFTHAHVPHNSAMACHLPDEMGRSWTRHGVDHRTISSGSATGTSMPVDGVSRTISDWSPTLTTTSLAPACLAARITRATSAWVSYAGRRGILLSHSADLPNAAV